MKTVKSSQVSLKFSSQKEPAIFVQPGEIVKIETDPKPAEQLFTAGDDWVHIDFENDPITQVSGPVFIEGVEPGDGVAVEILNIEPLNWGWNCYIPGFSLVASRLQEKYLHKVEIKDGWIHLSVHLKVPVQPCIGILGLAPSEGESTTFGYSPWGGNYDLTQMTIGNTAIFPAQAPGGLFYLGDLHAAMGAGEPTYVAIECAGTVTVRFNIRKQVKLVAPRIESSQQIYILGLAEGKTDNVWEESRKQACELMFDFLVQEQGLTSEDAYLLFSASVDLTYGGPAGVSVASIPLNVFK